MIRSVRLSAPTVAAARTIEFTAPVSERIVFVVASEFAIRRSLNRWLRPLGYQVQSFQSAADFFRTVPAHAQGCVVVDIEPRGTAGLDVLRALRQHESALQPVAINGAASVALTVDAMRLGASDVLATPLNPGRLFDAIAAAVEVSAERAPERAQVIELRTRYDTLTPRQREVCALVVQGRLNKQIAWELGTSEKTVKAHRARVMAKLQVRSVAELVRVTDRLAARPHSSSISPEWRVQSPSNTRPTINCA